MSEKRTFVLSRPIRAFGEEVAVLEVRPATTADARAVGTLPYTIRPDESVALDLAACAKYVSRLAGVPGSSVDQLSITDFNQLSWDVAKDFLGQGSGDSTN
ncbi:phage tail assembly protein [Paracandidimonas soli]|uniref:Tail assembly chaperone E/41/14-like protein n=1 Tax=Paracandidimonas soli TaxID=1917182 RepID=A0A4V2VQB4_9BURK|nr:phage tail assembly protein [Paracandidimonas soli]TCU93949.1 tail assembly chaperone E/41/14-like protein [Paracandidimonas soli]